MFDQSRMLTFSDRLYSLLLLAYPARFRRAYGREMAQVFRDDIRGTFRESGPAGLTSLWFLVLLDLLKTAFAEHIWEVFHMPIEKLERWTGLAAALGGALVLFITFFPSIGYGDEFIVSAVLFIAVFLMWAIALAGLYRRLPSASHRGNRVTFAIVGISLLLTVIGLLIMPLTESSGTMIIYGYFGIGLGIAGMGIIALRHRALGVWSFVPLLLAGAWLGFIGLFTNSRPMENPIQVALILLVGISWILLGIGLWTSAKDEAGPALPA